MNLSLITLGSITRLLRTIKGLSGKVYLVGGVVTEGQTSRDLDFVVTKVDDIPIIKKSLGKFSNRAHFMIQKSEPPATLFVKITGKDARSPDLNKLKRGKLIPENEYAGPAK
jgi:hypothetical protein